MIWLPVNILRTTYHLSLLCWALSCWFDAITANQQFCLLGYAMIFQFHISSPLLGFTLCFPLCMSVGLSIILLVNERSSTWHPGIGFMGKTIFPQTRSGGWFLDDSSELHLLCTLFLLLLHHLHLRSSDVRSQRLGTPIVNDNLLDNHP